MTCNASDDCGTQVPGENKEINVKKLNKRPMPPRFGRKLSPKQAELASHICLDCGAPAAHAPLEAESCSARRLSFCLPSYAGYIYSKP